MKVSLSDLAYINKQYGLTRSVVPHGVDDLVQKIGAQLGAVDEVIAWGERYKGIVVVTVVACEKHPNADKLHVCLVDDGGVVKHVARDDKGRVQVVCGAPNVRAGMLAAWIPPGIAVPATIDKDPFVLEARDIRGQMSNGMLASLSELGISDDHAGILEIDATEGAKPGDPLSKLYGLDDHVIDIENKMFTHRPDLFGYMGIAREIAGIYQQPFNSPDWYIKQNAIESQHSAAVKGLSVKNQVPKSCPRYIAVVMDGITVGPSPVWLQASLSRVGIRPINNIVDMTNYMMLLTGQPLHAFDFDKVAIEGRAEIIVRNPKKGEKLTLLDGKEITPREDAVLICDQDKPIALGGVMGGNNSEIDESTKRIIIECANFDMYNIRRTSMEHGIFTDAVTRFSKGQSPLQCAPVLYKAVQMTQQLISSAKPIGKPVDSHAKLPNPASVAVTADFVNERLGSTLSLKEMAKLLENVEFKIMSVPADKKRLHVVPPFWRTDIEIPEDIVEEVGRLHGYDNLPLALPVRSIAPTPRNGLLDFKNQVRNHLARAGANELLTYTFVHGDLMEKVGQNPNDAYRLSNALSPDLQYYRLSLLPSLLEKVQPNLRSDMVRTDDNEFALFEINPVHAKGFETPEGLPEEDERLAFVFAADEKTYQRKYAGAPFYQAKAYAADLLAAFGIDVVFHPAASHQPKLAISKAAIAPFDRARTALVMTRDGDFIGEIGEFSAAVRRNLKLPAATAGFEFDIRALYRQAKRATYVPLPRFPKVTQDITLRIPAEVPFGQLFDMMWQQLEVLKPENTFGTLGMPRIYQAKQNDTHKNITLRLWLSHYDRTLTAEEVNKLLDGIAAAVRSEIDAERI